MIASKLSAICLVSFAILFSSCKSEMGLKGGEVQENGGSLNSYKNKDHAEAGVKATWSQSPDVIMEIMEEIKKDRWDVIMARDADEFAAISMHLRSMPEFKVSQFLKKERKSSRKTCCQTMVLIIVLCQEITIC